MSEVTFDKRLAVRTVGIKEWDDPVSHYNRCEPTPYRALEHLFRHYSLEASDQFVDFGSGRGRVAFYVHNRFNIPVTGVEAQENILNEAVNNISRYRRNARDVKAPIHFEHGFAEHYEIKPQDTKFFFFNILRSIGVRAGACKHRGIAERGTQGCARHPVLSACAIRSDDGEYAAIRKARRNLRAENGRQERKVSDLSMD